MQHTIAITPAKPGKFDGYYGGRPLVANTRVPGRCLPYAEQRPPLGLQVSKPLFERPADCPSYLARLLAQLIDPPPSGAGFVQFNSSGEIAVTTRLPSVPLRFGIELRST